MWCSPYRTVPFFFPLLPLSSPADTSPIGPYTLNCYGPASGATSTNQLDVSLASCQSLWSSYCSNAPTTFCTSNGLTNFILDCPCYQYRGGSFTTK